MKDMTDATFLLAAGVVERAYDLLNDGWIKGKFYDDVQNPTAFCIMGALQLASMELVGQGLFKNDSPHTQQANREVMDLACVFICEAAGIDVYSEKNGSVSVGIPGFNDNKDRLKDEILKVMRVASENLWNVAIEGEEEIIDLSMYNTVEQVEPAKQYLYNVLVN